MYEEFVSKLKELILPLLDNPYFYLLVSIFIYCIGGIDESLVVLFCLNVIDLSLSLLSNNEDNKKVFINKLKIYLVIMVGVMLDKLLGIESRTTTRARTYIILAYSYNEIANIVNLLCSDETFFIPKGVRLYMKKLNKRGEENDEQDKQKK